MKTTAKTDSMAPLVLAELAHGSGARRSRFGEEKVWPARAAKESLVWIVASLAGLGMTGLVYHHQFASGMELFPGPRGDTRLSAYLVEHGYQALSGRADWLSPGIFYPVEGSLGFSDAYLSYVPLYSILRFSGLDIFLALSLTLIVFSFVNYLACFAFLKRVLGFGAIASCVGATFFAFNSPKMAQADHLQLQPVFLLPIIAALVISFSSRTALSARAVFGLLGGAAFCLSLQLLTSFYIGWFFIFWCFLFVALCSCIARSRNFLLDLLRRQPKALIGAAVVLVLTLVPFFVIYLPAASSVPAYGVLPQYIPEFRSYWLMADGNYVWHRFTDFVLRQAGSGPDWGRRLGIGLAPAIAWLGLSVFALREVWRSATIRADAEMKDGRRRDRTDILFFALAILATNLLILIGLQYNGHSLWNYVYLWVPGAKAIRAVARYEIVLTLPMSIGFAFLLDHGIRALSAMNPHAPRWAPGVIMAALAAFGLVEQLNSGAGQYFSISAENARLQKLAAKLPENCSSFYLVTNRKNAPAPDAFDNQQDMHDAMLISAMRHVPTLNGRSGKTPRDWFLRDIRAADYEKNVGQWISTNHLDNVCRLSIDG